jgi:hypothetical protein
VSAVLALQHALIAGARVFVRDGRLVVQSQGELPTDVRADLKAHRDRLIEILTLSAPVPARPGDPQEYKPWLDPKTAAEHVWYPGTCYWCARPMHDPDYVCSVPLAIELDDEQMAA